jgi:hypothetical protein
MGVRGLSASAPHAVNQDFRRAFRWDAMRGQDSSLRVMRPPNSLPWRVICALEKGGWGAQQKSLHPPGQGLSLAVPFFARVVELVDTQVSEACA